MCRNCFWDIYWGRVGQLLASFSPVLSYSPKSLAKVNSARFVLVSKVAN